ncbi:MAG TPA: hypothetical protein VEG28_03270, partial [Dehalococcoidia bacterium]|nr:hypothetical protein [Dehalococcoidia bacterium]
MRTIISTDDRQLGPFPMHRLKQVDKPTTLVTDSVQRIDRRNIAFIKAGRGDYGPAVQEYNAHFRDKLGPLTHAIIDVAEHLSAIKPNEIADSKAPLPENPTTVSRHIKSFGYFLGADCIGICRLPAHAIYSHNLQGNPININYKYAVVIASRKHYPTVAASMGYDWIADPISQQAYLHSAFIAQAMASYIRRLGYPASAQHGGNNYEVQMPPLLLWAGIGEVSRLGI